MFCKRLNNYVFKKVNQTSEICVSNFGSLAINEKYIYCIHTNKRSNMHVCYSTALGILSLMFQGTQAH